MFMVREMYRHARLSNWKVVFVTYVIVHELAHLIEANHTPRFWNIVRVQVPTVEKARSWLSENGQVLEEEI
jgi:predicted metal-dependent hydrolase